MATIPIEVIVQDEASPEPTPTPTPVGPTDPGDNTNITVPDTGAGTVDSNNSFNNSSVAISIVSIVIALLAIGAVVTLLVHRYNKRKKTNIEAGITRQEKRAMAVTSTIAILALTVLLGQLAVAGVVSPITTNAATDDTVNDEAELDVDSKITIIATRTEDEDTAVATVKNTSTATSHQAFGYKVTASMVENATTANLYLDGDETSEYYIAPVSNEGNEEDEENEALEANTWGYTLAETSEDYLPIPLVNNPATIVKGYDNIENEPVDIYYTIRIDRDLPAGTYIGELEYGIDPAIEYMQDLATIILEEKSTLLTNMAQNEQYILKDNRDEKPYYISKLADGNVWMTQNLDFDIVGGGADLNSTNTDVPENWVDAGNLANTYITNDTVWGYSTTAPESYDPGDLYWSGAFKPQDEAACTQYGGTWKIPSYSSPYCDGVNFITSTGDNHYYLGNCYNWTAAVAMSNSEDYTADNTDVNQSICPAGWTLPKSGTILTGPGSFQYLADQAELSAGISGNIQNSPTYFVYSGSWWGGSLGSGGDNGNYWSSVVESNGGSYQLDFDASGRLYSQGGSGYRGGGSSIRCLAR